MTSGWSPPRSSSGRPWTSSRRTETNSMDSSASSRAATSPRGFGARSPEPRFENVFGDRLRPPAMDAGSKHLVELKARYEDLGEARALMAGSEHVGTFRQVDTYFSTGERRLKVRSVAGSREGQLVYYERPDQGGVKESRVLLAPLPDVATVLEILKRILPVQAEVRKTREIHRYRGVQVHLDTVKGLGKFIEFEKVLGDESEREAGRLELETLRKYFQIPDEDLMASSYSDLVETDRS